MTTAIARASPARRWTKLKSIGTKLCRGATNSTSTRRSCASLFSRRKAIETGEDRLGDNGGAGLRHAGLHPIRQSGARIYERGVLAAPFRCSTIRDRRRYIPLNNLSENQAKCRSHQLDAVGRGGARLRSRWRSRTRLTLWESPVRRLRQRRPGGVRPVHLVR